MLEVVVGRENNECYIRAFCIFMHRPLVEDQIAARHSKEEVINQAKSEDMDEHVPRSMQS